jgi:MFS family permease
MGSPSQYHDTRYEFKTLALICIGFGLLGLDRWLVAPLYPFIMRDLGLNYQQLGSITGILGIAWGFWSIVMGPVSDRFGRKKLLIGTMIGFSLLSSLTAFAGSFVMLIMIRAIMGVAEGAFTPISVAVTGEASAPSRRGFNLGLQLSMFSLFGFGFAPIIATQLLRIVPSWHFVFMISAIPGLIIAGLMAFMLRSDARTARPVKHDSVPWTSYFRSRNVLLGALANCCAMAGLFIMGAMTPTYVVKVLNLDPQSMGFVVSAMGLGGLFATLVAGLSDYVGRKPVAIVAFIIAAVLVYIFRMIGPNPVLLFILLCAIAMLTAGLLCLMTGPVATEGAPIGLVASSIGFVSGSSEIFGGGIAPIIAGILAQHFGLGATYWFAVGGLALGALVSFFLVETAPRKQPRPVIFMN